MICWNRVNELRDEVGNDDFLEVVEIFLEEVDEVMERLRQDPDPSTYEAELHFLKGSALSLGFSALADLCSQGEKQSQGPDRDSIDLGAVIQTFGASRREFNNGQGQADFAA